MFILPWRYWVFHVISVCRQLFTVIRDFVRNKKKELNLDNGNWWKCSDLSMHIAYTTCNKDHMKAHTDNFWFNSTKFMGLEFDYQMSPNSEMDTSVVKYFHNVIAGTDLTHILHFQKVINLWSIKKYLNSCKV